MILRIKTSKEEWEKEAVSMTAQGFYICARDNEMYWEQKE